MTPVRVIEFLRRTSGAGGETGGALARMASAARMVSACARRRLPRRPCEAARRSTTRTPEPSIKPLRFSSLNPPDTRHKLTRAIRKAAKTKAVRTIVARIRANAMPIDNAVFSRRYYLRIFACPAEPRCQAALTAVLRVNSRIRCFQQPLHRHSGDVATLQMILHIPRKISAMRGSSGSTHRAARSCRPRRATPAARRNR